MWVYRIPGTFDALERDLDALWEAGASGVEERSGEVLAYFTEQVPLPLQGTWTQEAEQDWQEIWKRDLKPVQAGSITIVPPWLKDAVPAGQTPLLIEVGMAFGTGHHATTRMAVQTLSEMNLTTSSTPGPRVLDVGTGSGVLAIAASLLGASVAVGVDIDPITIPAAYDNARMNGFSGSEPVLRHPATNGVLLFAEGTMDDATTLHPGVSEYDLIVANLYAELHDTLMGQYRQIIANAGRLVLTGILNEKLPLVLDALHREGFEHDVTRTEGEWALVTARA